MRHLIRYQLLHSQSRTKLSSFHFSKLRPLYLSTVSKSSKRPQTKKTSNTTLKNQVETCSIPSLFQEITDILGVANVTSDRTPTGISASERSNAGELVLIEESLPSRPGVCQNAQEKSTLVEKEENLAVLDDTQMGKSVELDVSPVVREITKIVRAENALVSMEEQLDKSGLSFEPEIVEKVLKRCFRFPQLAFRFFNWVKLREGFCHTTETFNTMLSIAGEAKEYRLVENVLGEMEEKSCKKDIKTWTILISNYGKSKLIGKALEVFENMEKYGCEPDAAAYRMMIRALYNADKGDIALELYKEMVEKEMSIDLNLYKILLKCVAKSGDNAAVYLVADDMIRVSQVPEQEVYGCVLESFCISGKIREALELIRDLKKKDFPLDPHYFEILVKGLCRADRIADALEIVDIMKRRELVSGKVYEIIINGYLRKNDLYKALDLFKSMKESGYSAATSTYTDLMQRLFRSKKYQEGCDLYNEMLEKGVELDIVAIMAMVAGHVRQNYISEAWKVFNAMEDKGIRPTWKSYSIFIKELIRIGKTDEIFKVLSKMQEAKVIIGDEIFHWVISCMERKGEINNVEKVKQVQRMCKLHSKKGELSSNNALKGQESLVELDHNHSEPNRTEIHLVQPLSKAYNEQDLEDVCSILSSSKDWLIIEEALERCTIKFTPELVVETLRKSTLHGKTALNFFSWVGKQVGYWHSSETYNMAIKISGCGKDFKNMRRLFYEMRRRGLTTPDTWAIMIMQYGRTGLTEIALSNFAEMKQEGFNPTASTYKYLIISLCAKKGRKVDEAIKIYPEMIHAGYTPDKELLETYLGCLCEVGKLSEARSCIDSLSKIGFTVPLSYSLYIRALCRAGRIEEALDVLDNVKVEKSTLDQYVYGSLIHGLLRKGKLDQAFAKVDSMKQAGISPTVHVYTSFMVHYCKDRQMDRALGIFAKMQKEGCQPTIVTYSAMIRGYMNMEKFVDAWKVFRHMRLNGPKPDFETYSMFIHCLCKVGRSEEAMQLLSEMRDSRIVPSSVNFRTVFYGLNREGKQDLAQIVLQQKSALKSERKLFA
ncbi:hypothetical protein COLO4_29516 [Corchorus olitorius]|uniref:Pentacotripeptide-repeat region of PRORP domain-containing protein n=1 Tax=Corchorus olitorius TaxID=93759 RepID=A0A1R3HE90_9ROSI|nr:hypothetical protein COLO4_29516 [Corchorus olitorius]